MSAIDHKASAEQLLEQAEKSTGDPTVLVHAAQAHATLYAAEQTAELVKQQRIANLQRYAEGLWESWEKDVAPSERRGLEIESARIGVIIREGLGLS